MEFQLKKKDKHFSMIEFEVMWGKNFTQFPNIIFPFLKVKNLHK